MVTRPSRSGPTRVRQGASGLVFQTLQQTMQQNQTSLLGPPGATELVALTQEFNSWLAAALANPQAAANTESAEARRLQTSLQAFLHAAGSRR
jgi:hypothetical protein